MRHRLVMTILKIGMPAGRAQHWAAHHFRTHPHPLARCLALAAWVPCRVFFAWALGLAILIHGAGA